MDKNEETQIFDRDNLHHRLGGDQELITMIVEVFLEDTPKQIKALKSAILERDVEAVTRIAHSIKGAAANVGGQRLKEAAYRLEQSGREDSQPDFEKLLLSLENDFQRLAALLSAEH